MTAPPVADVQDADTVPPMTSDTADLQQRAEQAAATVAGRAGIAAPAVRVRRCPSARIRRTGRAHQATLDIAPTLAAGDPLRLQAVIAHELGHLHLHDPQRHRLEMRTGWLLVVAGIAVWAATAGASTWQAARLVLLAVVVGLVADGASRLYHQVLPARRQEELDADRYAADLGYAQPLIEWLREDVGDYTFDAWDEHPGVDQRIAALQALAGPDG